jgi:outer membrane protein TolC
VLAGAVALGAATFAQTLPAPATPPSLSLAEALDYAQSHYPSVRAALEEKVATGHDVDVARAAYLPQVSLLWQINRATENNFTGLLLPQPVLPALSGPALPPNSQSAWNSGAGVLVTWRPYDFGYRAARVDAARQAETAAVQAVDLTELQVLTATANAYMNVVAAQSLAGVAQANVDRLHTFTTAIHVLVDNKLRPGVDAAQADAAEALARTILIEALDNIDSQKATLAKLVGRPTGDFIIDGSTLENSTPPQDGALAPRSIEAHPAALQQAARVKQQSAQLHAIDSAYAPQFDLIGSASGRAGGKTSAGVYPGGDSGLAPDIGNWAVGLQVTLPLGTYPALRAQQGAQRARLDEERDRYEETLGNLNEALAQAQTALSGAEQVAQITPTALAAARQSESQQRVRYRSGLATVVDVTTAEAALAQAESQDAIARLDVWRAVAALDAARGDLSPLRDAVASSPARPAAR